MGSKQDQKAEVPQPWVSVRLLEAERGHLVQLYSSLPNPSCSGLSSYSAHLDVPDLSRGVTWKPRFWKDLGFLQLWGAKLRSCCSICKDESPNEREVVSFLYFHV